MSDRRPAILCAPDSFKGSLSAMRVAEAMAAGIATAAPDVVCDVCPVADGGEGTLDAILAGAGGRIIPAAVTGPRGEPIEARLGMFDHDRAAVVELADAAGLMLVPEDHRHPLQLTTYGVGELMRIAIDRGCTTIIVAIGGSATIDGGTGLAQALGARLYDKSNQPIDPPITGGRLSQIARIEPATGLPSIRVACDVTNPLCGTEGAAHVYGPQKGATPEEIESLDAELARLAQLAGADPQTPGFGAAGGAGFGLATFCHATLERGIDLVLDLVRFDDRCADATMVLTGEGRLDAQSLRGKACLGVAVRAAQHNVPTIALVGDTGDGWEQCVGDPRNGRLLRVVSLTERFGIERARREPESLIARVAGELARDLR